MRSIPRTPLIEIICGSAKLFYHYILQSLKTSEILCGLSVSAIGTVGFILTLFKNGIAMTAEHEKYEGLFFQISGVRTLNDKNDMSCKVSENYGRKDSSHA